MIRESAASLISFYQKLKSLLFPQAHSCRFSPTCSQYTKEAILSYGILKGIVLGAKRIIRCNPHHPGGHDPIPSK